MIPNWIRQIFGRASRRPARQLPVRRARVRPSLQMLEDRCVPAIYTVDSLADVTGPFPPTAPPPAAGSVTLREALTAASATAGNFGGLVADAGPDTIVFNSALIGLTPTINLTGFTDTTNGNNFFRIATDVTIDASNLTSLTLHRTDPGTPFRFFEMDTAAAHLTLTKVTLDGGKPANTGGAIFMSNGTLTLNAGTKLQNNTSQGVGDGGAIFMSGGTLNATSTTFSGNKADNGGALAISAGNVALSGCTLSGNTANFTGGAIAQSGGSVTLDPTTISGNTAAGDGGGVSVTAGTFTLSAGDQVINNSTTGGNGGGISISGTATLNINGTAGAGNQVIIAGNRALNGDAVLGAGNGGGISLTGTGTATIKGAVIGGPTALTDKNQALVNGGGLFVAGGTLLLNTVPSMILSNTAAAGGGVAIAGGTAHSFTSASIASNLTTGNGAGINLLTGFVDTLTIIAGTLGGTTPAAGNTATGDGGGVNVDAGTLTFSGLASTVQSNKAARGGGINFSGTALNVTGATITANSALTGGGGGVRITLGTVNFGTSTISNNLANAVAGQVGGGVAIAGGTATFGFSTVSGNTSTGSGGGVNVGAGTLNLNPGTQILNNSTTGGDGGGVHTAGAASLNINGVAANKVVIAGNQALNGDAVLNAGNGGGLYLESVFPASATIQGAVIGGPTAATDKNQALMGGGIGVSSSTVAFNSVASIILNNTAATGAGIAVIGAASNVSLISTTINANKATGSGGGLYVPAGTVSFDGATVGAAGNANTAARGAGIAVDGNPTLNFVLNTTNIVSNSATTSGGGIDFSPNFTGLINLGAAAILANISNNLTTANGSSGGGFALRGAGTVVVANATIGGNQANGNATSSGGGIAVSAGIVNLNGTATLGGAGTANSTTGNGGGVAITGGTFNQNATSRIIANTATGAGGGVFANGGNVNFVSAIVGQTGAGNSAANGGGIAIFGSSIMSITALSLQFNTATASGGGLYIDAAATQNINLGAMTIQNNSVTGANGMGGGIAKFNAAGSLTLTGATVRANTATGTGATGGGLFSNAGTVTLTTVTFGGTTPGDANTASTGGGGGISIAGGTVTITNGIIQGNTTTGGGGGLLVNGGAVTLDPTTITGNTSAGDGGGVNVLAGTFTLSAGDKVINNTTTGGNGGGINVAGAATLNINGGAGVLNQVTIAGNKALNPDGNANKGNGGGIALAPGSTGTATIQGAVIGGPIALTDKNQALVNGGGIFVGGGTLLLNTVPSTIQNNTAAAGGGIAVSGGTGHSLTGVTISSNLSSGAGAGIDLLTGFANTLTLIGSTIGGLLPTDGNTATGNGGGISVDAGTLAFSGAVTTIQNNKAASGGGVQVDGGSFTLPANSTITQNTATSNGGGLLITSGTAIISGTISNNQATSSGGGVFASGGTFTLNTSGSITGNTAGGGNGGGIAVVAGGSATISGTIAGNSASTATAGGGGAFISGGTITFDGATIGGTTAAAANTSTNGGGLSAVGGTVNFFNNLSTVRFNTASSLGGGINLEVALNTNGNSLLSVLDNSITGPNGHGGGISIRIAGNLTINGLIVARNHADQANNTGGGIFQSAGVVALTASTIGGANATFANTSTVSGGGADVTGGTFSALTGTFVQNNTSATGGGINFIGTTLTITSATITANSASLAGGGLAIRGGTIAIHSGTISSNLATGPASTGGGIDQTAGNTTVDPTVITGNTAVGDGGGVNIAGGVFSLTNGDSVTNNTSTAGNGGGIAISLGTLNLTGTTITGNKANNVPAAVGKGNGGGIAISGGTANINGSTIGNTGLGNDNQALFGGGIGISGGTLNFITAVTNIQFNTAKTAGGGIDVAPGFPGTLVLNTFTNVASNTVNGIGGQGGGVALRGGDLNVISATISANQVTNANGQGGGIYQLGGNLTLSANAVISGNQASGANGQGGGIFENGGSLMISGSTIGGTTGNTASASGGGIFALGGSFAISATSIIRNNTATNGDGGGLFVAAAGNSSVVSSTIAANKAPNGNGGGIHLAGTFTSTLTLTTVTIGGPLVTDGNQAGLNGGGININAGIGGNVDINGATNNVIQFNTAGGTGGGINLLTGQLKMTVATLQQNSATGNGGGLAVAGGVAGTVGTPISRTTFAANTSLADGGGIAVLAGAFSINNCTLARNSAVNGAGINLGGGINSIVNVTVAANMASGSIGGILKSGGTLAIRNTLVGTNTGPGPGTDISNTGPGFTDNGFNLFQSFAGFVAAGTDVVGQNPIVAPLGNYGGPNQTVALLPGSPAIDKGTGAGNDQRGVAPVGVKDIGAYESRGFTITGNNTLTTIVNTVFEQTTVLGTSSNAHLFATVTPNAVGEPVAGGTVTFSADTDAANGGTATVAGNPATINAMGVAESGNVTANQFLGTFDPLASTNGTTQTDIGTLKNRGVKTVRYVATGPTDTLSGRAINTIQLQTFDQDGLPLAKDGVPVTLDFTFNPADIAAGFAPQLQQAAAPAPAPLTGPVVGPSFTLNTGNLPLPVPHAVGDGIVTFQNLFINTTGRYTFTFHAPQDVIGNPSTALVGPPPPTSAYTTAFNIRASKLKVENVVPQVRSGANLSQPGNPIKVTAVGEDGSRDLFFTTAISLQVNSGPGTFFPAAPAPAVPGPTAPPPPPNNFGIVTFPNVALGRGSVDTSPSSLYTLGAASTSLGVPIAGAATNTTLVTASSIVVTYSSSTGSTFVNRQTGQGYMPVNTVRSANQAVIGQPGYDPDKDILNVTVQGRDILNPSNLTIIGAAVSLSVDSATQFRNGVVTPIQPRAVDPVNGFVLGGITLLNAPTNTVTFGLNAHLTLNTWGDYILRATAQDGVGFNAVALSNKTTVIARTIVIANPQFLVIGPFSVITQALDINGDIAQNYNGPSDPTQLTINDIANRQATGITPAGGTTATNNGTSVVATANPVRGVTVFNFVAARPVLINAGVIDQLLFFIGSDASNILINPLDTGRRRPRPLPATLTLRIRPN